MPLLPPQERVAGHGLRGCLLLNPQKRVAGNCRLRAHIPQEGMAAAAAAAGREESFHSLLISLAKTVRILVEMKEKYPETYKFVDAKMMDPTLSYSQLAERFSCRKQNVLYHLKKAVSIHPELSSALIVDTRFSRGIHALRTSPKLRKDQREGLGNEC